MGADIRLSERRGAIGGETRTYPFDFNAFPELVAGATIVSAVVTINPSGPTISHALGTGSDVGKVLVTIETTTVHVSASDYEVTCISTLDDATPSKIGIRLPLRVE